MTTVERLHQIHDIHIIKNILEYADVGLDLFCDELKHVLYLKLNPYNKKFYHVNRFFSQIQQFSHRSILHLFNAKLDCRVSQLIVPNRDHTLSIYCKQIKENDRDLINTCKIHYKAYTINI